MSETLTIKQANALNGQELLVTLSDGRSVIATLDQVLSLDARVLLPDEPDED